MLSRVASALGLLALSLPHPAGASPRRGRVVLMPPENSSGFAAAPESVVPALAEQLRERGWEIVDPAGVEGILRVARARRVDSLSEPVRRQLAEETAADAVLYSTVETWLEGGNAIVALSARLTGADGALLWSAVSGASAAESTSPLGFRRAADARELLPSVLERLTRELPRPGERPVTAERRARPLHAPSPATFRSTGLLAGAPRRLFVLPFANLTQAREAPRQIAQPLARRLAASGLFALVESADFRAALLAEKVPSISRLDASRLRALAERLDAPLYLRGTLWRWREGSAQAASVSPEVELELELVEAASERVLWAAHHARAGTDYESLLLRGAITSAVALADQTLAEMVDALLDAEPAGAPRPAAEASRPTSPTKLGDPPR